MKIRRYAMIRLFVSDLDGTLLNDDHMLDEKIKQGIQNVLDHHAYFSVATGRNMSSGLLEGFEDKIYHICMNGAVTVDPNGNIISKHVIDKKNLIEMMNQFPDLPLQWISENHVYLTVSKEEHFEEMKKGNRRFRPMDEEKMKIFMKDFVFDCTPEEILSHDIVKVNCMPHDPAHYQRLEQYLAGQNELVNAPCDEGMFEITNVGVNKGEAVMALARSLGIDPSEVAVYGDGGNDLEMLEMFENSYSPSSALACAKEKAHHIIGACKDYGVITHITETIESQQNK